MGPNQAAKARIDLIPLNAGPSMLLANFQSQKLSIKNFIEVNINQWEALAAVLFVIF